MAGTAQTSTLLATERKLRPTVLTVVAASELLSLAALACSVSGAPRALWLAGAAAAAAPAVSNHHYLRTHETPTIGMMPVALLSLVPALACVLAMPGLPRVARLACGIAECVLGGIAAVFAWWFVRLRRAYSAHPDLADNASLIVLGGAIKHRQPCTTLARRLDVAARILYDGPRRVAVVSGGPTPDGRTTEAREMARYLMDRGIPSIAIALEPTARNTRENISRSCALLDSRGRRGQRCVVSSDYHLWRALREARAIGVSLTPIAAPTPRASVPQQWSREVLTILFGR